MDLIGVWSGNIWKICIHVHRCDLFSCYLAHSPMSVHANPPSHPLHRNFELWTLNFKLCHSCPPRAHIGLARTVHTKIRRIQIRHITRVGQNHIYTVYIRYFWLGDHQIYGHIRCLHTVPANPTYTRICIWKFLTVSISVWPCMGFGRPYICAVLAWMRKQSSL